MSQISQPQLLEAARSIAKLLNLSPEGTEIWARKSAESANVSNYNRIGEVEIAIGQELARPSPDRALLNQLIDQYAAQTAWIRREQNNQEIADAFELSPLDRQKLGQFIEQKARIGLKDTGPALQPLP